jgi:hypothetical protein
VILTWGRADQAVLLGAKKVTLPGPSISSFRLALSVYIWVVDAPATPRVLYMSTRGSAGSREGDQTVISYNPT